LGRQHVHCLRPTDARHQFQGKGGHALGGKGLHEVFAGEGVELSYESRAGLEVTHLISPFSGGHGFLDLDHKIGSGRRSGVRRDGRTGLDEYSITDLRTGARAGLYDDFAACGSELFHGIGRSGDAKFSRAALFQNPNLHCSP
jgi:hypothetical protein